MGGITLKTYITNLIDYQKGLIDADIEKQNAALTGMGIPLLRGGSQNQDVATITTELCQQLVKNNGQSWDLLGGLLPARVILGGNNWQTFADQFAASRYSNSSQPLPRATSLLREQLDWIGSGDINIDRVREHLAGCRQTVENLRPNDAEIVVNQGRGIV